MDNINILTNEVAELKNMIKLLSRSDNKSIVTLVNNVRFDDGMGCHTEIENISIDNDDIEIFPYIFGADSYTNDIRINLIKTMSREIIKKEYKFNFTPIGDIYNYQLVYKNDRFTIIPYFQ